MFWEDPQLAPDSPPASALLRLFLSHTSFPREAAAHIRVLQYAFGPQSLIFAARRTRAGVASVEVLVHAVDSRRPSREVLLDGSEGDLSVAAAALQARNSNCDETRIVTLWRLTSSRRRCPDRSSAHVSPRRHPLRCKASLTPTKPTKKRAARLQLHESRRATTGKLPLPPPRAA